MYRDAKRFYLGVVYGYATSLQQAANIVESEYNSIVRQTRVKNYLNTLRMTQFASEGLEPTAAIEKVYNVVTKLARQVPRSFRGDFHCV